MFEHVLLSAERPRHWSNATDKQSICNTMSGLTNIAAKLNEISTRVMTNEGERSEASMLESPEMLFNEG